MDVSRWLPKVGNQCSMSFGQLLPSTSPDSIFHYQFPRLPYFIHWRIIALQCYVGFCSSIQFSRAVVSDPATPWTAARQGSLSFTNSQSLLKPMSTESVMPTNHLIFCHPLLLLPSVFPSIRVFSYESVLHIWWPKNCSFSFSVSPLPAQEWLMKKMVDSNWPGHKCRLLVACLIHSGGALVAVDTVKGLYAPAHSHRIALCPRACP